jgi:amino acid transporter
VIRGIGLPSAVAINVATMIGAGPLITIPLVVASLHGSVSVWPWIAGALIALCDGLVFAELASRFPRSGGTYTYLREAFGSGGAGRLVAFVYVWQFFVSVPLILATGYIGFAQYSAYLIPAAGAPVVQHAIALAVGTIVLVSLYRTIPRIARTALVLGAIAVATLIVVAATGFAHPVNDVASLVPAALSAHGFGIAAFGAALVITLYDYAGYNDVCQVGDEVIAPARTIPLAILISIGIVAVTYVALNLGVFATLPIREIAASTSVASLAVERAWGHLPASVVTVAILITAFASTYGGLLGASRVPYAAALEGDFLPAFGRLHPTKHFPYVSLLAIGLLALPATLFPLDAVINALTAGAAIVAGVGQTLAVIRLRAVAASAPFRLPLYPLPALVAMSAWLFLFWSSGPSAMLFGALTLAAGGAVFLTRARRLRAWPFAVAALALVCAWLPAPAGAQTFDHARIVQRDGTPQLLVDGAPFFFFGGAFFYERLPPERWREAMLQMRALGANTLDLYVPWNWHEIADGAFDFDGHTNPRRNLREVLRLARELGFHLIVRPGPVIRNEWRNGGYPAWLLERPAYGMPLHDVLEGRYPATATLQNANSDDAAAQWLANPTHLRYASRWLHAVLHEFQPYADLVIAIALDDDQGAYIDNQTWPAPHLRRYLDWLQAQVRDVAGPAVPTFINTYDMKVPASSPVWAMGNWYQSDAYAIGDHDRVELDFATATLTAQERVPLGISEFQAGWLASPEDPQPRAADPSNTTLALAELLAWGAHGVVDFPLQDTLAPFGWEAPFSNAFYAWDAAVPFDPQATSARRAPTERFGAEVRRYGAALATTHRVADIAIVDEVSASDPAQLTNGDVASIAAALKDALRACNDRGLTCDVVDLRFSSDARLRSYRTLVVPPFVRAPEAAIAARLARLRRTMAVVGAVPVRTGSGVTVLAGRDTAFAVAVNWSNATRTYGGRVALGGGRSATLAPFSLAARDAALVPIAGASAPPPERRSALPGPRAPERHGAEAAACATQRVLLNPTQAAALALPPPVAGEARVVDGAALGSGDRTIVLANDRVVAVIVPDGGARLVAFALRGACGATARSLTDATGALRDDVLLQQPPSPTDRIAAYTHSYPAGTFNRPYRVEVLATDGALARVRFSYDAPDLLPHGARIVKTIGLAAGTARLVVDETVTFAGDDAGTQRAVRDDALAVVPGVPLMTDPSFLAWNDGLAISVAWPPANVERTTWTPARSNGTLARVLAPGATRTTYALAAVADRDAALAFARAEREWLADHPNERPSSAPGEVAKW